MNEINFMMNNMPRFPNGNINSARMPAPIEAPPTLVSAVNVKNVENFVINSAKSLYEFFANAQSAKMAGAEMSLILKDMLGMQKDLGEFLSNMSSLNQITESIAKPDLAKLLLNNQLDLIKLTQFMQENGKEALSKLFSMTAKFAQSGSVARSSQISEFIAILNACTPNSDTSQVQVLKNMLLLYLPWLPLGEQNFSLEIGGKGNSEGGEGVCEDSVTVMIKTVHFGNVSVLIFKGDGSTVNFNIKASKDFPKDEVIQKIKLEAKDYNVQTELMYEARENAQPSQEVENSQTEVNVNTGTKINPFLILMAQTAIRVIIEIDKNFSLVENRKEKL